MFEVNRQFRIRSVGPLEGSYGNVITLNGRKPK